jgi:hypothetical protein
MRIEEVIGYKNPGVEIRQQPKRRRMLAQPTFLSHTPQLQDRELHPTLEYPHSVFLFILSFMYEVCVINIVHLSIKLTL